MHQDTGRIYANLSREDFEKDERLVEVTRTFAEAQVGIRFMNRRQRREQEKLDRRKRR